MATAISNMAIPTRIIRMSTASTMTIMAATSMAMVVMDTTTRREFPVLWLGVELGTLTGITVVTTMRMPTTLTSMRVATMRVVTTIKMNTIMTGTMSKDNMLLASTRDTLHRADAEETQRRARRPSATSP